MTVRKYSSRSQQTTLSSSITAIATTMNVTSATNLMATISPTGGETYTVVIDPDTAVEEIVDVTGVAGSVLTIVRGVDNAGSGSIHSAGAVVRHMVIGRDLQEANDHKKGTLAAHAATTSAQLAGVISDETGSGSLVFATSPTLVTPVLGVATATSINGTTIPSSATLIKVGDTGTVDSTMIFDGTIVNADINASAGIVDTKLATIATASKVSNTATTAASTNTASAIVARDASGNFSAGTITANLTGTASAATLAATTTGNAGTATALATGRTIALTGDVSGTSGSFDGTGNASITAAIAANIIVDADINAGAAIDWTKLGISSTVSSTEIGYVDGVTSAIQAQIDSKLATTTATNTYAPIASPTLTGVPLAPTAASNTNSTQIATTAYVQTELTELINAAPGALDTLYELANALNNDTAFSTTITNSIATKLPLAGGTMSGAIAMGTNKITGVGNPTNAQDVATKDYIDNTVLAPSNLTGPITSVGAATTVAAQTGTGSTFVMNTSPTIVTPTLSGATVAGTINGTTIPSTKTLVATDSTAYVVPSQTSNSGKYLTTNGTTSSWGVVDALPSQTGNSGKYLTTNGSAASWAAIVTDPTPSIFMLMGA